MGVIILLTVLLILNVSFGVKYYQHGNVTKGAALSWFAIGWLSFHLIIIELPKLL